MYNELFSIGPITIYGYGLSIGLGVVAALLLAWRRAAKRGLDTDIPSELTILALIVGFAGAKILYVLTSMDEFLADPLGTLGFEGFVVYGGIITGLLGAWIYCRKKKLVFAQWIDIMMPPVAAAQGFGRIGCFLAGCCYGLPTDSCLGVVFPAGSGAPAGIPLWPTQLFSAGGDFLIAAILLLYDRKEHPQGRVGLLYLLLYGVGRFIIEFFRNDPRGNIAFLSTSQFISIFAVAGAIILMVMQNKRKGKENV